MDTPAREILLYCKQYFLVSKFAPQSLINTMEDAGNTHTHTHTPGAHTPGAIHTHTHTHTVTHAHTPHAKQPPPFPDAIPPYNFTQR